jgi:hypothetical protein
MRAAIDGPGGAIGVVVAYAAAAASAGARP